MAVEKFTIEYLADAHCFLLTVWGSNGRYWSWVSNGADMLRKLDTLQLEQRITLRCPA
jgi:hypothetical protein